MAKNEDRFLGIDPTEVYKYMLSREDSVPAFGHHSPQLKHRLSLVEWISSSCHRFTLTATCVHLAVIILDQFMDNFIIDDEQLYLLAISCVQISGKLYLTSGAYRYLIYLSALIQGCESEKSSKLY